MKKLLTTITLLCFSVSANADVWFCEEVRYSNTFYHGDNYSTDNSGVSYIVDTDKGIRMPLQNDYRGTCEQTAKYVLCSIPREGHEITLSLDAVESRYTFTFNQYGFYVYFSAGTCTKA